MKITYRDKEPLIKSERVELRFKIFKSKAEIEGNSRAIAKIPNAGVEGLGLKAVAHDLIRGSLRGGHD